MKIFLRNHCNTFMLSKSVSKMIPYIDLTAKSEKFKEMSMSSVKRVITHGQFINGIEVTNFERKFSDFLGGNFFTGVANGTAALYLALKSKNIGPGDEVITTPLSYLASTSAITLTGAKAVLCDVDETLCLCSGQVEQAISKKTKAVILVHLYGNITEITKMKNICEDNNIILIEDCAQANGSSVGGKLAGTFGDFGCFSFHPLKTLAAIGDAGGLCTSNKEIDCWLKAARNHGHSGRDDTSFWSHNMRLDAIQAAILLDQLPYYRNEILESRLKQVEIYLEELQRLIDREIIKLPRKASDVFHSYNMFVIMVPERNSFINYMMNNGVEVKVHYPYTIDQLSASWERIETRNIKNAKHYAQRIVSLPLGYHLSKNDIEHIASAVVNYFR